MGVLLWLMGMAFEAGATTNWPALRRIRRIGAR